MVSGFRDFRGLWGVSGFRCSCFDGRDHLIAYLRGCVGNR